MSSTTNFHKIRQYLLGEISEESRLESIENEMLADKAFLTEVEMAEADLIEEYLAGSMNARDAANFESHFLAAGRRKDKFRFMLALSEHAEEHRVREEKVKNEAKLKAPKNSRGVFSHDLANWSVLKFASMALLFAAFAVTGFWVYSIRENKIDKGLASLKLAYARQRPTDVRLSIFDYAPARNTRGDSPETVNAAARTEAGLLIAREAQANPNADSLRALGVYYASQRDFDNALAQFDKGRVFNPTSAEFFADHGAVQLETVRSGKALTPEKRYRYLEGALAQLDKAIRIDGNMLSAYFNRAMCLQEMGSVEPAREAWNQYLEKDPSSEWAREARERLALLDDKKIEAKSPPQVLDDFLAAYDRRDEAAAWKIAAESKEMITGTMVSEQLTRGLLSADAQKAPERAGRMLSALSFLGDLEKKNAGDVFFSELAAEYLNTTPQQRTELAAAQSQMLEGYELTRASRYAEALAKFEESRKIFTAAGNMPETARAEHWIAYTATEADVNNGLAKSLSLAELNGRRSYKWLQIEALLQAGTCYIRQSNYSRAIQSTASALQIAGVTANAYNRQKAAAQLIHAYSFVNDSAGAIESMQTTLAARGAYFNSPRQMWRNYIFSAQAAFRFGMPETAIAYGQESFRISRESFGDAASAHNSLVFLSGAYKANNQLDAAFNTAGESAALAMTVGAGNLQNRLLAMSFLQTADIERDLSRCADAVGNYRRVIALNQLAGRGGTIYDYQAKKGKLLCEDQLGTNADLDRELPGVISLAEDLRSRIEEERSKTSFFADEQSIYEFAAARAVSKGDNDAAFNLIERGKARSLLDKLQPDKLQPGGGAPPRPGADPVLPLSAVRARMPAECQVVQYAVLPERLLIWIVDSGKTHFAAKDVSAAELDAKVRRYMREISVPKGDIKTITELQTELDSLLLEPVRPYIDRNKSLSIIPDKTLNYLPFETLRAADGKLLVENQVVSYAPSATLLVALSENSARRASPRGRKQKFLGVGNPDFDRARNPDLPALPDAEKEIGAIAALYERGEKFLGVDAVKEKIVSSLPAAQVFHYAGHFKVNDMSPQFSRFLLAGRSEKGESDLTAAEIGKLKLDKTDLVILSACNTAIEDYYRGEGAIGVARTFFAAGTPTVVASRWDVDSGATARLMTGFHRFRIEKDLPASAALRAAQLEMIAAADGPNLTSPYYWASFATIGGI